MQTAPPDAPLRVLVVEDNQDLARLFCDLLDVMGCETDMAFTARSALDQARRNPPELVFCDLRLPGEKDGFDVAKELRADEALAGLRLIAVSGLTNVEEQKRAIDAGFDRVFAKPVKFAQIQEVLAEYRRG
jgi:CheY-like chemotaxis protein